MIQVNQNINQKFIVYKEGMTNYISNPDIQIVNAFTNTIYNIIPSISMCYKNNLYFEYDFTTYPLGDYEFNLLDGSDVIYREKFKIIA